MSTPSNLNNVITAETKEYIRQFMQVQAQLEAVNKQLVQLRNTKKQIETGLITRIKTAGLAQYGITYQGRKLYIGNDNTYDTLTFKFLEDCLTKLYGGGNMRQVKQIIDFIKQQRLARKESTPVIKIGSSGGGNVFPKRK